MQLAVRMLKEVASANSFTYTTQVEGLTGGDRDVYVQLADLDQLPRELGFDPPGLRYLAQPGATLVVTLLNLDDARKITRVAVQPFSGDTSIWKFALLASDPIQGTTNLQFVLTEGVAIQVAYVQAGVELGFIQPV